MKAYLAKFLLEKGYIVHGIKHRTSSFNTSRIDHIYEDPHTPHGAIAYSRVALKVSRLIEY